MIPMQTFPLFHRLVLSKHRNSGPESGPLYRSYPVSLNGTRQWIHIRSRDISNPILLWLDGGPGLSERGWVHHYHALLEHYFTVVNWDQRGTGRSGPAAIDWRGMTPAQIVNDTVSLSLFLKNTFVREKILMAGRGWGALIGSRAAASRPDLYRAWIGIGLKDSIAENDRLVYRHIIEQCRRKNRHVLRTLERWGPPPYGPGRGGRYGFLFRQATGLASGRIQPFERTRIFRAKGQTLPEKYRILTARKKAMQYVYPLLAKETNLPGGPEFGMPVYLVCGRYDPVALPEITAHYFQRLRAPSKTLVWFEKSGHYPCYQEPERFNRLMIDMVLPARSE